MEPPEMKELAVEIEQMQAKRGTSGSSTPGAVGWCCGRGALWTSTGQWSTCPPPEIACMICKEGDAPGDGWILERMETFEAMARGRPEIGRAHG